MGGVPITILEGMGFWRDIKEHFSGVCSQFYRIMTKLPIFKVRLTLAWGTPTFSNSRVTIAGGGGSEDAQVGPGQVGGAPSCTNKAAWSQTPTAGRPATRDPQPATAAECRW